MRFGLEVVEAAESAWPEQNPLFFRISSIDGAEKGTTIKENIIYAKALKKLV